MWKIRNRDDTKYRLKQKKMRELIESMLKSNVDIHYGPNTGEYFIVDMENSISVLVTDKRVKLANHLYTYESPFNIGYIEGLKKLVKNEVQRRTDAIKKELFKNEIDLFNKISKIYEK